MDLQQSAQELPSFWQPYAGEPASLLPRPVAAKPGKSAPEKLTPEEELELKFSAALDDTREKSAQRRAKALETLGELLRRHYMPDRVEERRDTLLDGLEKALRRGKTVERSLAARLVPLLVIQLEGDEDAVQKLTPYLLQVVEDESAGYGIRADCCKAVALAHFLIESDCERVMPMMKIFEGIFSGSYTDYEGNVPNNVSAEMANLHASALSGWCLLLTLVPEEHLMRILFADEGFFPIYQDFLGLLQSTHLVVREAAGDALALIADLCCFHDTDDKNNNYRLLEEMIDSALLDVRNLVKGQKNWHRSKGDLNKQRNHFRVVLDYLENGHRSDVVVTHDNEPIKLNTWKLHYIYTTLCLAIGSGVSFIPKSIYLRQMFKMSPSIYEAPYANQYRLKCEKEAQKNWYAKSAKRREIQRAGDRSRRMEDKEDADDC